MEDRYLYFLIHICLERCIDDHNWIRDSNLEHFVDYQAYSHSILVSHKLLPTPRAVHSLCHIGEVKVYVQKGRHYLKE